MLRRLLRKTERCAIRDCNKPVEVFGFVAATGGLDPERVELAGFCSQEHADRIPPPSAQALDRARAAISRRFT
jgi:hypothetical protein